jgi:hypothetical protein
MPQGDHMEDSRKTMFQQDIIDAMAGRGCVGFVRRTGEAFWNEFGFAWQSEFGRGVDECDQCCWVFPTHVTYMSPGARRNQKPPLGGDPKRRFLRYFLVGATGFEPATFATPLQRATKLRHAPTLFSAFWPAGLSPENEAYTSASAGK